MPLSRKENAKRAIHFQRPDYIPLLYYDLDEIHLSDIAIVPVQTFLAAKTAAPPNGALCGRRMRRRFPLARWRPLRCLIGICWTAIAR